MAIASKYVLITPARDEGQFIELTLKSVINQTYRPIKWIVVSDGSTDGTDAMVSRYAAENPWIELVRLPERRERHFAGKVFAFNTGFERVARADFDVVGNLDGDVSFGPGHFENLLSKFDQDPDLGVAGAPFREGTFQYDYRFSNIENVWGGCQLFRKECFKAIGGYVPIKGGSIDHVAVLSARMKGWKTRTFTESICTHHRVMGTAQHSSMASKFRLGSKDYAVGNHPVWQLSRTLYQMRKPPFFVGGIALGAGYMWSMLRRVKRPVSDELVAFTRREQMRRLTGFLRGKAGAKSDTGERCSTTVQGATRPQKGGI